MRKTKVHRRFRLTHAAKRESIALGSVMIRIPYRDRWIECSTREEAIAVMQHLEDQDAKKIQRHKPSPFEANLRAVTELFGGVETSHWTRELFWKFIEEIGETQKQILALLVRKRKVTDEEMRKALKLESNQQLAGFLSGISKQAGALNIPARSVFTIENESQGGEMTKAYVVAADFLRLAVDQNWPTD